MVAQNFFGNGHPVVTPMTRGSVLGVTGAVYSTLLRSPGRYAPAPDQVDFGSEFPDRVIAASLREEGVEESPGSMDRLPGNTWAPR